MWRFGLRILIYLLLVVVVGYVIYFAFDLIAGEATSYDNKSVGQVLYLMHEGLRLEETCIKMQDMRPQNLKNSSENKLN
ncbi:hypothetical protein K8I28_00485 [bacterium]|nr:hypothetical protein [bacterium]